MTIRHEPEDDLRSQAPDDTDWERIEREAAGAAWSAFKDGGADTELAAVLLSPGSAGNLWAVEDPKGPGGRITVRLSGKRPQGEDGAEPPVRVVTVMPGAPTEGGEAAPPAKVEIPAELADRLGLARSGARSAGEVMAQRDAAGAPRTMRRIESGLAAARRTVEEDTARVVSGLEKADLTLRDLPRPGQADYYLKKRRAGKAAIATLDDVQAVLEHAEGVVVDYPELLRGLAPGRTPVGDDPKYSRLSWYRAFQSKRDELARLRVRAREYAEAREY